MIAVLMIASSLLFAGFGGSPSPERPASISGVLTDTTGRGLPGARITIRSDDGERHATVTDSSGRYHVSELRSGGYTIEASMAGFDARSTGVEVATGADAIWSGALLVASPLGQPSIERQVAQVAGSDALDCGRYTGPTSDTALQRSLVCALASAEARRPFSVIVQFASGSSGRRRAARRRGWRHPPAPVRQRRDEFPHQAMCVSARDEVALHMSCLVILL